MRYALAFLIIVTSIVSALAAEELSIPEHDVDKACATLGAGFVVAPCIRDEQQQYEYLKYAWDQMSPAYQRKSVDFSRNQGPLYHAFYKSLALFVSAQLRLQQMDDDATAPSPRFQR